MVHRALSAPTLLPGALDRRLAVALHRLHHLEPVDKCRVESLLLLLLLLLLLTGRGGDGAGGRGNEKGRLAELAPNIVGLLARLAEPRGVELPRLER